MNVFCWRMRMSFWSRLDGLDQKLILIRPQNTFATEYKHYFFYNRQKKNLIFEGKLDEENQSIVTSHCNSGNAQMKITFFHT
jgi:hypothetical protein